MSTQNNNTQPDKNNQQATREQTSNDPQKSPEISLPRVDRPEGPFEHSADTARMTEEERQEKEIESNQPDTEDQA